MISAEPITGSKLDLNGLIYKDLKPTNLAYETSRDLKPSIPNQQENLKKDNGTNEFIGLFMLILVFTFDSKLKIMEEYNFHKSYGVRMYKFPIFSFKDRNEKDTTSVKIIYIWETWNNLFDPFVLCL